MNPLVTPGLAPHGAGTALSVNLNKVALLRNQRTLTIPSGPTASVIARAQRTARAGPSNDAKKPSPAVSISTPR